MVNERWAYPSYHSIAHEVGRSGGRGKYNSGAKTKKSRVLWYYTVKDEAGKLWAYGKGAAVAKEMKVSVQRLSGCAMYGFRMFGKFTVTREQLENEDLS